MLRQTLLLVFFLFLAQASFPDTPVRRGERPPIDLSSVPDEAWKPGIMRIQFADEHTRLLDENPVFHTAEGVVRFGIAAVDSLNKKFAAHDATAIFDHPALQGRHTERHRKWGFHLWYDIRVCDSVNIIEMVKAYQGLEDIRVAEPHYRKELHGEILDAGVYEAMRDDDIFMPDDPFFHNQWHYHNTGQAGGTPGADISLPAAWAISTGHNDVIVAVIDGGILTTHPDLAESMWEGTGYNFAMNTPTIQPGHHGTHVAGTIAARSNNGLGVAGIAGGWTGTTGVKLMSLQVFSSQGNGGFELAPVFGADNGAAISQNSWGYSTPNVYEQVYLDAIDYFNEHGGGEVMDGGITLTSAGNSGDNDAYYPGYYPGAVAVAATNNQDQKAGYSNYGTFVEVSAPGGETSPQTAGGVYSTTVGNSYSFGQGTSMACPHASGVVALMLSVAPGEFTNDEIRLMLQESADNHYGANPGYLGLLGSGRVNAHQALLTTLENMSGVSDFQAEAENNHRALLSWQPNHENEPVMLTWNTSKETGTPSWDLQPGDTLPDGGKVLYKGFGQAFSHVMPSWVTDHHYQIQSYSAEDGEFSRSSHVSLTRRADTLLLPFAEPFEHEWWPPGWESRVVSEGSEGTGTAPQLSLTGGDDFPYLDPSAGQHMVRFNASEANLGSAYRLVSAPVSTAGLEEVSIEFDWYAHDIGPAFDGRLALQLSPDGAGWTTIGELPEDQGYTEWQTAWFALPNHFVNREKTYVGFLFEAPQDDTTQSGDMFIDNISMYAGEDEWVIDFYAPVPEVVAGERVLIKSKTAGKHMPEKRWWFGEDATPEEASGRGPHEVVYREAGSKTVGLIVNDSVEIIKEDLISVLPSAYPAPSQTEASVTAGQHIQLSWEWHCENNAGNTKASAGSRAEGDTLTPGGFNIYRNGIFHQNIPHPETVSYLDENVPEGWQTYMVKAYFEHPHQESPPGEAVTLAINETEVVIATEGEGTTEPPPGTHAALTNDHLSVEAFPGENHGFLHWKVDGEIYSADNPASIPVSGPHHIMAVFQDETSVAGADAAKTIRVFPNPATGKFTVASTRTIIKLEVSDLSGQRLYFDAPNTHDARLSLPELSPGMYLVSITTSEGTATKRVVIQ